jgi:hypothetical protein
MALPILELSLERRRSDPDTLVLTNSPYQTNLKFREKRFKNFIKEKNQNKRGEK